MPIYAYACATCGHRQDHLQKMADPLITVCPSCGAESYSKQLSAPQFQLKGGGWYVTDFRDNGKKDGKKADAAGDGNSDSKSDSGSTDGGSGESKSDAKTDTKANSKSDSKSDGKPDSKSTEPKTETKAAAPAPSSGGDAKAA